MFQLPWSSDWWKHVWGVAASLELLAFAGTEISRRQCCTCVCGWTPARHRGGWQREGGSRGMLRAPRQDKAGHTWLFCWGNHTLLVCLSFKKPTPALTVSTTCLSDSLGCSRGQNKTPPLSFDLQDTETIAALRTKMAFYAWHLRSRALTGTKGRRQPLQTKADPTTTWKTELQESKVQHDVLKCQMYFKGLGFPFSPAFTIVGDTNTRGLFSYSSNGPNFSLKSSIYYICQEKKKENTKLLNHISSIWLFFFFSPAYNYPDAVLFI